MQFVQLFCLSLLSWFLICGEFRLVAQWGSNLSCSTLKIAFSHCWHYLIISNNVLRAEFFCNLLAAPVASVITNFSKDARAPSLGHFPGEGGLVAPGMSCYYVVQFIPEYLSDYKDYILVESQTTYPLLVPLEGRRPPPILTCEFSFFF